MDNRFSLSLKVPATGRGMLIAALCFAVPACAQWNTFARTDHHDAQSPVASQSLNQIHWQTPVDLHPLTSRGLIHYGSPLITASDTIIVPVKTGLNGGFEVEALHPNGSVLWSLTTDYILPGNATIWTPVFGPALTSAPRLYYPGAGGTVYYRDSPDSATGTQGQLAFYGISQYTASARALRNFNQSVLINTPITTDSAGNIYFGFQVVKNVIDPVYDQYGTPLSSGIARISASGVGSWAPVTTVSGDSGMTEVAMNCAPALSQDEGTLYFAVSNGSGGSYGGSTGYSGSGGNTRSTGYLAAVSSSTLAPLAHVHLVDPKSGLYATITDDSSASPTVGPDGDVYYGVLENPCCENNDRGWMLHFSGDLSQLKTPGAFGWDDTASIVPASMVPSYEGSSSYLIFTKYNNYANTGTGNGENKIAILDPNATETDPVTGVTVMNEVMTILGVTPNPPLAGVKEWCINSAAVDPSTKSILANSEDGNLYRWDLTTNTLSQKVTITDGVSEAYTPTVIGVDGTVYAINNAILFAVGQ